MMHKRWTSRERKRLVEMYNSGNSFSKIGVILGRQKGSVRAQVFALRQSGIIPFLTHEEGMARVHKRDREEGLETVAIKTPAKLRDEDLEYACKRKQISKIPKTITRPCLRCRTVVTVPRGRFMCDGCNKFASSAGVFA
ncbi:hypothetical protein ACWM9A_10795 [Acetobacter pasteurianus]